MHKITIETQWVAFAMMRLTRKADYGLRLMLEVAAAGRITGTAEIAQRQDMPYQLLRKVALALVRSGLLASERGARGGLSLARPAETIPLLDIVTVLDSAAVNRCTADPPTCDRRHICAAFPVWLDVQRRVEDALRSVTLAYLVARQAEIDRRSAGPAKGRRSDAGDSAGKRARPRKPAARPRQAARTIRR